MSGEYATAAPELAARGMVVVPADTEAKAACIKWRGITRPPMAAAIDKLSKRFPNAGLAVLTGPSKITVIDIDTDDERLIEEAEHRFGSTPFVVRSPRGGRHFYYRTAGERNSRLKDLPGDIRGRGGLVIAPPTAKSDGRSYEIVRGGLEDLARLPPRKPGSLPARSCTAFAAKPIDGEHGSDLGHRNDTLFGYLMRRARECSTEEELALLAQSFNETFAPPMSAAEVASIVASVWRYRIGGRIFSKGETAQIVMGASDLDRYRDEPEAFFFLCRLRQCHAARCRRHETFALSIRGMVGSGEFSGWSRHALRRCRDVVLAKGDIELVKPGGHGEGDVAQFRFGHPIVSNLDPSKGAEGRREGV